MDGDALNKCVPFILRQSQYERNHNVTARPDIVEGFVPRIHNCFLIRIFNI